jgi:outer membrane lipoprotein carrier protein
MHARAVAVLLGLAACVRLTDAGTAGSQPPSPAAADAIGRAPAPAAAERVGRAPAPVRSRGAAPRPSAAPAAARASCPEPAAVVQKLQARYDTTSAFRAEFRQETRIAALGESEEALGTVAFKKPGKMRWEFQSPEPQSIISDGTTLWIYQPADRQVLKAPFKAAFVSTTPVSFLSGVGRISEDFRSERDARGCSGDRLYVKLVPKSAQDLGGLTVAVDPATFDIVGAAVTDPIGNTTTLTFSKVERNAVIPDEEFRFEVPPGVDVVTAPAAPPP